MRWQPFNIKPSEVESLVNYIIRLDKTTWQQIADKLEVTSVLKEWQKMENSKVFPPCVQQLMVIKAERIGLEKPKDRKMYALCNLKEREDIFESEALREQLSNISQGKQSLSDLVIKIYSGNVK